MINSLEKLEIVKERGEPRFAGALPRPPAAAKMVSAISRIEHYLKTKSG